MSSSCRHTKSAKNFESAKVHARRSCALDCIKAEMSVHWLVNFSQLATAPAAHSSTAITVEVELEQGIIAVLQPCVKSSQLSCTHTCPTTRSDTLTTDTDPQTSSYSARQSRHFKRDDCSHGRSSMLRIVHTVDGCCCAVLV